MTAGHAVQLDGSEYASRLRKLQQITPRYVKSTLRTLTKSLVVVAVKLKPEERINSHLIPPVQARRTLEIFETTKLLWIWKG